MRTYAVVSAIILMFTGVVGFAFNDQFNIPWYILLVNLILGFWGLMVLFQGRK